MKILLFAKNGRVGSELQRSLKRLGDVLALDRSTVAPLEADYRLLAGRMVSVLP